MGPATRAVEEAAQAVAARCHLYIKGRLVCKLLLVACFNPLQQGMPEHLQLVDCINSPLLSHSVLSPCIQLWLELIPVIGMLLHRTCPKFLW